MLTGHHELLLPLLVWGVLEELGRAEDSGAHPERSERDRARRIDPGRRSLAALGMTC